jgi:hypothetical protein
MDSMLGGAVVRPQLRRKHSSVAPVLIPFRYRPRPGKAPLSLTFVISRMRSP